ncbi:uncharacterized protein F5Z01DRAFT_656247 [Emericellopsis atlantica]|uniref:Uncharacterized protein n=1 Tax=Emericellopsis atlantica TaxID=2614577 RepID=A0A9P7ZMG4_9HYPO|nr:uncharacterized protein F5Z01DRAFT_656247 [Emericellopsis atlantica]KAG9254193.1 hypothetical protein F5Z01DRAFT_656247 [Emericellopsis atlantica]
MMMLQHTAALLLILLCTIATLTRAQCTLLDSVHIPSDREVSDWFTRTILGKEPDYSVHYSIPAGHPWHTTTVEVCQDMPDPAVCQVLHYDVPSQYVPTWWNGPWSVAFPVWRKQNEKNHHWELFFGNSKGAHTFHKKDFRFNTVVNNGTHDLHVAHTVHAWYHKPQGKEVTPTRARRVLFFEFQDVSVRPVVKRVNGGSVAVLGDVLLQWKRKDCRRRIPIFRIDLIQGEYLHGAETRITNFLGVPYEHRYFVKEEVQEAEVPIMEVEGS